MKITKSTIYGILGIGLLALGPISALSFPLVAKCAYDRELENYRRKYQDYGAPNLQVSTDPDVMVSSYPREKYLRRNFVDYRPFGSLDEVIILDITGKKYQLDQSDLEFKHHEAVYDQEVYPQLSD